MTRHNRDNLRTTLGYALIVATAFAFLYVSRMAAQEPITITPGLTTIAAPGLKIYTVPLGIPCGPEFPVPGCLPAAMQGWMVQIEGGDRPFFNVTLTYRDAEGRRHTHTQHDVPRVTPDPSKPSWTVVPFYIGRAASPPMFPTGTVPVRTEVWYEPTR